MLSLWKSNLILSINVFILAFSHIFHWIICLFRNLMNHFFNNFLFFVFDHSLNHQKFLLNYLRISIILSTHEILLWINIIIRIIYWRIVSDIFRRYNRIVCVISKDLLRRNHHISYNLLVTSIKIVTLSHISALLNKYFTVCIIIFISCL